MKVCVLQPDFSTTDLEWKNFDPPRDLSLLLPGDRVDHVFVNKLTAYKQLRSLRKEKYDIYVNLCEGYLDWPVPGLDLIHAMDILNLPYTGPGPTLFDVPKALGKYVAAVAGVRTPPFALVTDSIGIREKTKHLSFPLFVKPAHAGDSLGVDQQSLVHDQQALIHAIDKLTALEYEPILVEEYIDGREFTVLVAANIKPATGCVAFKPIEYRFPNGHRFKTHTLKTSELHTDVNLPTNDASLEEELKSAAEKIFNGFAGVGYARMDFRMNANREIYFLELNFTCSVFYEDGYEASADYILNHDPIGKSGFLRHIIAEGMARHVLKQKKYRMRHHSINGYGIVAHQDLKKGEVIFNQEEAPMRIVTRRYVEQHWTPDQMQDFKHYAYPISDKVYVLWDTDPLNWAPQNHSCNPNTIYDGLNVVAMTDIKAGEELTLDYSGLLDETIEPFACTCGAPNCRKMISGTTGNSITARERGI